jgi:hypothetical protein
LGDAIFAIVWVGGVKPSVLLLLLFLLLWVRVRIRVRVRVRVNENENITDPARLRAKVVWYEKGEQSTKYYFNLVRKNGQKKLRQKIRGLDGNLKYDIDEILDEQINFYANQFSTEG